MPAARSRWIQVALLGGGIALLAALFVRLGARQILELFRSLGWNLVIVILIFAAHEGVRAMAVKRCLLGDSPPFGFLLKIRFLGEGLRTLTYTGPFLSEPARAWMLASREGLRGAHAYAAAMSELIANSAMSALVTAAALALIVATGPLQGALRVLTHVVLWSSLAYVAIIATALALRVYLIGGIARRAATLPWIGHRLTANPVHLRDMEEAIFHVLRDRPTILAEVMLLELVAQILLVVDVYWTLRSMGVSDALGTAVTVEALTKLANIIQFVGVSEGSYALVFGWLALSPAAGFSLSIVKRVRSLAVATIGLVLLSGSLRPHAASRVDVAP